MECVCVCRGASLLGKISLLSSDLGEAKLRGENPTRGVGTHLGRPSNLGVQLEEGAVQTQGRSSEILCTADSRSSQRPLSFKISSLLKGLPPLTRQHAPGGGALILGSSHWEGTRAGSDKSAQNPADSGRCWSTASLEPVSQRFLSQSQRAQPAHLPCQGSLAGSNSPAAPLLALRGRSVQPSRVGVAPDPAPIPLCGWLTTCGKSARR